MQRPKVSVSPVEPLAEQLSSLAATYDEFAHEAEEAKDWAGVLLYTHRAATYRLLVTDILSAGGVHVPVVTTQSVLG